MRIYFSIFNIIFLDIQEFTHGAGADLQRSSLYSNNNNNVPTSKDLHYEPFNPQIHSSNYRSVSSDNTETSNAHLLDHNYAASAYDECFGDSWKGKELLK